MTVSLAKVIYSVIEQTPGFLPDTEPFVTSDPSTAYSAYLDQLRELRDSLEECKCYELDEALYPGPCDTCIETAHIEAYIADLSDRVLTDATACYRSWAQSGHTLSHDTIYAYFTDPANGAHRYVGLEAKM